MFKKLLATNLILIAVIVCALVFGMINTVKAIVGVENESLRSNVVEVGFSQLNGYFQNMQSILLDGCVDDTLQQALSDFNRDGAALRDESLCDSLQLALRKLVRGTDCVRAELYPVIDGAYYRYDAQQGVYAASPEAAAYPVIARAAQGGYGWVIESDGGESYLRAAHLVYSMEDWATPVGMITVDVSTTILLPFLRSIAVESNDIVCLLDADNNRMLPRDDYFKLPEAIYTATSPASWTDENLNHYFVEIIPECGWKLVGVLGQSSILRSWQKAQGSLILLTAAALAAVFVMVTLITRSVTRPIMKLADHMHRAHNASQELEPLAVDARLSGEVLTLYQSFNDMQKRQNDLINEVYVARIEEQKAQMRALMAQINPHFLYNTLDSINWMAMKYKAEDIQLMVSSLATMLRHSLNKGNDFISLKNELDQARSYIQIQQMRFKDWFDVRFDVDPELLDTTVIKLILQPLVENAITHGFERGMRGLLVIEAARHGDDVVLRVKNNGHAIDLQKVYRVMYEQEESEKSSGYGLRNVNARLIRHYGDRYAIAFSSKDGWTIASIRIPSGKA